MQPDFLIESLSMKEDMKMSNMFITLLSTSTGFIDFFCVYAIQQIDDYPLLFAHNLIAYHLIQFSIDYLKVYKRQQHGVLIR